MSSLSSPTASPESASGAIQLPAAACRVCGNETKRTFPKGSTYSSTSYTRDSKGLPCLYLRVQVNTAELHRPFGLNTLKANSRHPSLGRSSNFMLIDPALHNAQSLRELIWQTVRRSRSYVPCKGSFSPYLDSKLPKVCKRMD